MSTTQRLFILCIFLNVAVIGSARLAGSQAVASNGDLLAPSTFVSLEEQIITGKNTVQIQDRYSSIVDTDSRVLVRFDKTGAMNAALAELEAKREWNNFHESDEYKNLKQKLDQTSDKDLHNELETLIAAREWDVLSRLPGYDITVTARVFPKNGEPFDIGVLNYSTVRRQEAKVQSATASESVDSNASDQEDSGPKDETATKTTEAKKSEVVSTVTTTVEHRLYRSEVRLRSDRPEEAGTLETVDEIADGIIDLSKEKLTDGDRLEVTVTNYQGTMTRTFTWLLELEDCGLKIKQDATLLLVKRSGSPAGDQELENNFKPAPGSSFLLRIVTRNRAVNFLDPSFGINGSFLDFRKDKDLEVGVGPTFSVFNGIVQFSAGWNLNTNSNRFYWALGLGFLDIAGKIKELAKK